MNRRTMLALLGAATALCLAPLAAVSDAGTRIEPVLVLWGLAHLAYLAAVVQVARPASLRSGLPARRGTVALILILGLVPRLALAPAPPFISEDLYRYLWDGRLTAQGVNPYAHAPDDPALSRFHDGLLSRLNHAGVPTVYPPVAQLLFAGAAVLGATPLAWKGILFLLEGLLVAALLALLARRRLPPERLLLYYWNPLVVVECYGSGHVDLAAAAFVVLAIGLAESKRRAGAVASGIALGLGTLTKWLPALLVPALVRRRAWVVLGAAAITGVALFLPFLGGGADPGVGLRIYARDWEFNGPLYLLLRPAFDEGETPRWILAFLLAAASVVVALRANTLSGAVLGTWIAFVLCSPTVYPWYLVPAVALLPLHPNAGLLALTGTAALTYLPLASYRAGGPWSLPSWIPIVEYGLAAVAWAVAASIGGAAAAHRRTACATEITPT